MFKELLNKQVVCPRVELLQFMYPNFRVVKSEFDIYPGEPFIYVGSSRYINKIQKRPEFHIIVSNTGEYDLSNIDTLIELCYIKHNKYTYKVKLNSDGKPILDSFGNPIQLLDSNGRPIKDVKVPHYLSQMIEYWDEQKTKLKGTFPEDFLYNWKCLWITGTLPDKEIKQNKIFLELVKRMNQPLSCLSYLLENADESNIKYLENNLMSFISSGVNFDLSTYNPTAKNTWYTKQKVIFAQSYASNVPKAVKTLLTDYRKLEDPTLRVFTLLKLVLLGGNV